MLELDLNVDLADLVVSSTVVILARVEEVRTPELDLEHNLDIFGIGGNRHIFVHEVNWQFEHKNHIHLLDQSLLIVNEQKSGHGSFGYGRQEGSQNCHHLALVDDEVMTSLNIVLVEMND